MRATGLYKQTVSCRPIKGSEISKKDKDPKNWTISHIRPEKLPVILFD